MLARLKEIYDYRDMIYGLVRRDLRGRYKGSFLGFLWNYINPMAQVLVYMVVFSVIFRNNLENFPIYLIVGMMPWNFFSESLMQGSGCIFAQADMVKKIYFPREVLVISTVTSRFINFLINYFIVVLIIAVSRWGFNFRVWPYLLLIFLIEYVFALALTLLLSSIDVYFRDFEYMTGVLMMVWIWVTPIMYDFEGLDGRVQAVLKLNPMTPIICAYHNVLYFKDAPNMASLGKVGLLALVLVIFAEAVFMKLEMHFAEEL